MNTKLLVAASLLGAVGLAQAQQAGSVIISLGGAQITPHVDSADLTAPSLVGTKINVLKASQVAGAVTYFLSDSISIEIPVAPPFKHEVVGAGAIQGVGVLGTVKALPATAIAQYRFGTSQSLVRPFVGAGVTYAHFSHSRATGTLSGITGGTPAKPTILSMKSGFGPTLQIGASANLTDRISVEAGITKTYLRTTGSLSTGQTIETTLDPTSMKICIGYRF